MAISLDNRFSGLSTDTKPAAASYTDYLFMEMDTAAVYKSNGSAWVLNSATGVPITTTVNGHALSSNVTVTAADVGSDAAGTARPAYDVSGWAKAGTKPAYTAAEVGALAVAAAAADVVVSGTNIAAALSGKLATGGTAADVTVSGTAIAAALSGKQASGTYATGTGTASGTNTGDQTLPTDATIATTDVTTNNASTTKHGWLIRATAPAASTLNVVGIANAETVYANKLILDSTSTPTTQAFADAAAIGTSLVAAHADHKHAMMAAPTSVTGNAGTATKLAATKTINGVAFDGSANISVPWVNRTKGVSVITGTAARTLAAADLVNGNIQQLTSTTARTFTLDTGANITTAFTTAFGAPATGDVFQFLVSNAATAAITMAGGVGSTLANAMTVATLQSRLFFAICTGSNAWTIY